MYLASRSYPKAFYQIGELFRRMADDGIQREDIGSIHIGLLAVSYSVALIEPIQHAG